MVTNKKVKEKIEKIDLDVQEVSYALPRDQRVLTSEGWKRRQLNKRQKAKAE